MKKKLVVITGASSGIGKETAKIFNTNGYPLLLLARRVELLKELNLTNTICKKVDVADYQSFKKSIEEAEKKYGPVDLLINNAGIMPLEYIYNQKLEVQHKIVDINIKGVLNGMHTVIPRMKELKHGTIINISSVAGRYTYDAHSVYCGTKYAVHAISEQARKELADFNVRILTFAPAIVDTNLLSTVENKEILDAYNSNKKRVGNGLRPEDVGKMLLYMYQLPQRISLKEIIYSATKDNCC